MTTPPVPQVKLNDGRSIPQLGFGVFKVPPAETAAAVGEALAVGYRHVDTAEMYGNERGVGEAIRAAGLERDEVFVTSKLDNGLHRFDDVRPALERTLSELGLEQLDLFLIHWPLPSRYGGDFVSTWKAMIELWREGLTRSIGVSNFEVAHLERLARDSDVTPAVNQIELHPHLLNGEVGGWCEAHGIAIEAWAPIARAAVLGEPVIVSIAERLGRTPAQVVLRWHIQRGRIVFPKSVTPARIAENFQLFDFELGDADMAAIDGLDRGEAGRTGPHPDRFPD